jgi:thiamine biosynthesis lipoprotein
MKKTKIISLFLILIIFLLSSCKSLRVFEKNPIFAFATGIQIVFYNEDHDEEYNVIKNKILDLDRDSNCFEPNSTNTSVYDLNKDRTKELSDDLIDLLTKCVELKKETNGYFNPFIGRITNLWKNAIENENIPSDDVIKDELDIMKNTYITISGNTVSIVGEGNIDLGAIVKGYALEWAKNYLKDANITDYYINSGSSSIYSEHDINISIRKPYNSGYIKQFKLNNMGISTSSPEFQYKNINDYRYHHLISGITGYPVNIYDSVSVISENNLYNDCFSTAIFSMPEDEAISFSESKNIKIILFKNNNILYESSGISGEN